MLVALAAAALLLAALCVLEFGSRAPAPNVESKPQPTLASERAADALASLDTARSETIPPRESGSDPAVPAQVSVGASTTSTSTGPGQLVISAIDSDTRLPIARFYLRAVDGSKANELHSARGKTSLAISLLPGVYQLLVGAQGYEPSALPPVRVPPGETVTLDPVPLRAGDARVVGIVFGSRSIESGLRMELLGAGRRPCEKCPLGANPSLPGKPDADLAWGRAVPCSTCGYSAKSSVLFVPESGTATFQSLASGAYTLRLMSKQGKPIGTPTTVQLRAGETMPVELEYSPLRTLRVEILDTDGQSLATDWAARIRAKHAGDVNAVNDASPEAALSEPPEFDCWFHSGGSWIAFSSFLPPDSSGGTGNPATSEGTRNAAAARKWDLFLNRARSLNQSLRPEERAPELEPSTLPAHIDEDGLLCLESVPSSALTLELTCRAFVVVIAVPPSSDPTPLRARLTCTTKTASQVGSDAQQVSRTFRKYAASFDR